MVIWISFEDMTKKQRAVVREKFGGLCAYTGKPLDEKWQVDHVCPQSHYQWNIAKGEKNDQGNLLPAIRIVNHYKRGHTLESFRLYMSRFHIRLGKLPKKTMVDRTAKRKEYMFEVATLFDISPEKPFSGKFYFEQLQNIPDNI